MAFSTTHTFKAWNPSQGVLPKYEDHEFGFDRVLSRTEARDIIERVEGWVIYKEQRPRKGAYIHKPRARKAKC